MNAKLRKVLLISLPFWLVVALLCVKLISLSVENRAGMASYESGDHGSAKTHFSRLGIGNIAERWIAPYNRGTAHFQLRQYPAAQKDFHKAVQTAPPEHQCTVRINLALTLEALGDDETAAQNPSRAAEHYRQAGQVLAEANCADPTGKQDPSQQPSQGPSAKPSDQPSSQPSKGSSGSPSQDPSGKPSKGSSGQPSSDPNGEQTDPNGEQKPGEQKPGEQKPGEQGGEGSPEERQQRKEETQQRVEDKAEEADREARRADNRKPPEPEEQDQSDPNQSEESKQEQLQQQNQESQKENADSRDRQKGKSDKTEGKVEDPGGKKRPW